MFKGSVETTAFNNPEGTVNIEGTVNLEGTVLLDERFFESNNPSVMPSEMSKNSLMGTIYPNAPKDKSALIPNAMLETL